MLILRAFLILLTLVLAVSGALYLFTRDWRYLDFVRQTLRFILLMGFLFALLYLVERYVLAGWRALL